MVMMVPRAFRVGENARSSAYCAVGLPYRVVGRPPQDWFGVPDLVGHRRHRDQRELNSRSGQKTCGQEACAVWVVTRW
jgi:hypothetical protein